MQHLVWDFMPHTPTHTHTLQTQNSKEKIFIKISSVNGSFWALTYTFPAFHHGKNAEHRFHISAFAFDVLRYMLVERNQHVYRRFKKKINKPTPAFSLTHKHTHTRTDTAWCKPHRMAKRKTCNVNLFEFWNRKRERELRVKQRKTKIREDASSYLYIYFICCLSTIWFRAMLFYAHTPRSLHYIALHHRDHGFISFHFFSDSMAKQHRTEWWSLTKCFHSIAKQSKAN